MTIIPENSRQVLATTRQNDNGTIDCVVITPDNKRVCLSSGKQVAIHDAQTGRREYILSEASKVVTLCCNDTTRLIIYLNNGMRIEHDLNTNTALECRDLQEQHLLAAFEDNESRAIYIVCGDEELCIPSIKKVMMNAEKEITKELIGNESFKMPKIRTLRQLTLSDRFMAVCEDLFVRTYLFESAIIRTYKFTGKEEFNGVRSCFVNVRAFHSVSLIAALSFGRVLVWDNVIKQLGTPTQCVHWHRLAPSVVLTPQGAIISGGVEGVIVKYAAHGSRTGSTADSFLSRLGAAISRVEISEDGSLLVAVLMDNTVVMVLLSTMAVYSRLETLQRPIGTGQFALTVDPLMPHLVVHNGRPGCIQWINPCTMLTTAMLDVVSQNLPEVIQPQPPVLAPHMDVSAVALSKTTIMTAEQRVGDEIELHIVKFWRRNAVDLSSLEFSATYESSIRFIRSSDTSDYTFVSIDTANKMVLWERYIDEEYPRWAPIQSVDWKGLRITAASQICDCGLATIHEWDSKCDRRSTLVVWRLASGRRICEEVFYDSINKLSAVEWCAPPRQHILIACSTTEALAFDTHALVFKWSAHHANLMLGMSANSSIAYDGAEVIVLDEEIGVEKYTLELHDKITSIVGTNAGKLSSFLLANPEGYVSFACENDESLERTEERRKGGRTPFARLMDRRRSDEDGGWVNTNNKVTIEGKVALDILKGPSHSIAPIPKIALSFIESCLLPPLSNEDTE